MNNSNSLDLISKYRSHLMGVAMCWIISYHFFGKNSPVNIQNLVFQIGHGGVDIFLFLSGFGLIFGIEKSSEKGISNLSFFKKRLLRIIPTYFIVIIVSGLILSKGLSTIIQHLFIFGFFIPNGSFESYDWFIPSLILLYGIFIFYFSYFKRNPIKYTAIAILSGFFLTLALVIIGKGTIILFFSRISIFFAGVYFGYLLKNKKYIHRNKLQQYIYISIIILILEIILTWLYSPLMLRRTSLSHLPFFFITPGLCLLLTNLFYKIRNTYVGNYLIMFFFFIGNYSLEIYLIHMSMGKTPIFLSILITLILAFLLKQMVLYLMNLASTIRVI